MKGSRWRLHSIEFEFSALFAKIRLIFGKGAIPKHVATTRRAQVRKTIRSELTLVERTYRAPNIVANTLVDIAQRERKKAIRGGRYVDAMIAAVIEQGVLESAKRKKVS